MAIATSFQFDVSIALGENANSDFDECCQTGVSFGCVGGRRPRNFISIRSCPFQSMCTHLQRAMDDKRDHNKSEQEIMCT